MKHSDELAIFRNFCRDRTVVIWGLRRFTHTHSYIHANYYRVLKRNGIKVLWLDDTERNQKLVPDRAILICVSLEIDFIPFRSDITYFAHNLTEDQKRLFVAQKVLFYENFKNSSVGIPYDTARMSVFQPTERLLAQPYGTPVAQNDWITSSPITGREKCENWVGSIWNDAGNRGNQAVIQTYTNLLYGQGVSFRQIEFGKLAKTPIASRLEAKFVTDSVFGASIHSEHQILESNIVCRFFKSISFGKVPTTNQVNAEKYFPNSIVADIDLEIMLEMRLKLTQNACDKKLALAQEHLKQYTYEAGFNRMALAINEDWS